MVRRADFRLTVWLVVYALLAVSSIVLGDFSTLLRSARNDRGGRRQTVRLQTSGKRCFMHDKNTDGYPCQSVLRASQNQASTLDCRKETPCSNPELVVRECGLMLYVDVNPCFCHWYCFRNFQAPGGFRGEREIFHDHLLDFIPFWPILQG